MTQMMITSVVAGLVLSILAPFGTHNYGLLGRLAYWVGLCAAGGIGAGLYDIIHVKHFNPSQIWRRAFGQSIGATLLVSIFVMILMKPQGIFGWFITVFYVWTVAIVISCVGALLQQNKLAKRAHMPQRAALIERLPVHLRSADIFAITSEDHYVRIYTSNGDAMVLMRLSDAIKEAAPLTGLSPHRSWWVAEGGVKAVKRQDGKSIITLKNDVIVPVSRTGAKHVREAGWI